MTREEIRRELWVDILFQTLIAFALLAIAFACAYMAIRLFGQDFAEWAHASKREIILRWNR